jgi:hypothetical protein
LLLEFHEISVAGARHVESSNAVIYPYVMRRKVFTEAVRLIEE